MYVYIYICFVLNRDPYSLVCEHTIDISWPAMRIKIPQCLSHDESNSYVKLVGIYRWHPLHTTPPPRNFRNKKVDGIGNCVFVGLFILFEGYNNQYTHTLPNTNITLENRASQKESSFPTPRFFRCELAASLIGSV